MITILVSYALFGAVAGVLAGLLGIGGGLVIVPILVYCLGVQGVSESQILHIALGTSMASIVFTSVSSFMAHHRRGAVRWDVVKRIALGILTGTYLGSCVASKLSTGPLKVIFVVFLYYVATQLLLDRRPKASRGLPGNLGMFGVGNGMGKPMAGTVGYVVNGLSTAGLPDWSLGYVYLPALVGIVGLSVLTAPLGVRLAHSLPVDRLKRVFAVLLYVVGTRMLVSIL